MNKEEIEKKAMEIVNEKPFTSLTHPLSKEWAYDSAMEMAEWMQNK